MAHALLAKYIAIISINTAPIETILYVLQPCKQGEHNDIKIVIEIHNIIVKPLFNFATLYKQHYSTDTALIETILYAIKPLK